MEEIDAAIVIVRNSVVYEGVVAGGGEDDAVIIVRSVVVCDGVAAGEGEGDNLYEGPPVWEYECQQCQNRFKLPVPSSPSQEKEITCDDRLLLQK